MKENGELFLSCWQVSFNDSFTEEDARKASLTGELPGTLYTFPAGEDTLFDLDDLRRSKAPLRSKAILLCTIDAAYEGTFAFGMGVDWWFTSFVNGEKALDLGPNGNDGGITALANVFRVDLKKGKNTFAALTTRGMSSWSFIFLPLTESLLRDHGPGMLSRYYKWNMDQFKTFSSPPWVFSPSSHSIKVGTAFHSEVICGIRYRQKTSSGAPAPWQEKWTTSYGLKDPRSNHIFELEDLEADTLYEYEILRLNETAPAVEILSRDTFRTFPEKGTNHSFFAYSDLQVVDSKRAILVKNFMDNGKWQNTDFFASLGDIDSGCKDFEKVYFDSFLTVMKECGARQPNVLVRGNHEYRGDSQYYTRYLGRPYYSFQWGDVYYFVLDTGEDKALHAARPHLYTLRDDLEGYMQQQKEWLLQEVEKEECKKAKYHIVLAHAAPFAWISAYYGEKISEVVREAFYGKDPKCKLDLWLCGDVHCPFRFDPVSGEVYGALNKSNDFARPYAMGAVDRENITFPVYINSGPSCSTVDFSMTRVDVRENELELLMQDPDGKVLDHVIFPKEGAVKVLSTTFFRYPLQKELEAKGLPTPPRSVTPGIPWETLPCNEVDG